MQRTEPVVGVAVCLGSPELEAAASEVAAGIAEIGATAVRLPVATPEADAPAPLVVREVVADGVELLGRAARPDALVALAEGGMALPAMVMAAVRLGVPPLVATEGRRGPADDALEAALAAMGFASDRGGRETGQRAAELAREGPASDPAPSSASLERAAAAALGRSGWTDAVLHLLAVSFEAEIGFGLDDLERVGVPVLGGSLAPDGALGVEGPDGSGRVRGPARVFDSAADYLRVLADDAMDEEAVLVVRHEGPRGGPGMPAIPAPDPSQGTALVTDARLVPGPGPAVGHVSPEAAEGGPLAGIEDGDVVSIDLEAGRVDLEIPEEMLWERLERWFPPPPRHGTGAMAKYARLVRDASRGAVCY